MDKTDFWFYRLPPEFSFFKRIVWRVFGKKLTGEAHGFRVVGYKLGEITLVWSIEFIGDDESL